METELKKEVKQWIREATAPLVDRITALENQVMEMEGTLAPVAGISTIQIQRTDHLEALTGKLVGEHQAHASRLDRLEITMGQTWSQVQDLERKIGDAMGVGQRLRKIEAFCRQAAQQFGLPWR